MSRDTQSPRRIQDIERLRAIAAIGVVINHNPWIREGSWRFLGLPLRPETGVDLFFVISGFVVSSAFERDLARQPPRGTAGPAVGAFYLKRAARILPTAYLVLVLCWLDAAWAHDWSAWSASPAGPGVGATMASAFLMISNYAEIYAGVAMPLFWYWSVCVEEHFYLLYPAARLGALSLGARATIAAAVFVLVHVARLFVSDAPATILSHLRFDQLALGVLLGLAHDRWPGLVSAASHRLRAPGSTRTAATAVLAGLLVVLMLTLPVTWLVDLTSPAGLAGYLLAGLCALGIVALASCDADLLACGPADRLLTAIGARSYAVYMYHVPTLWLVGDLRFMLFGDLRNPWWHVPELVAYVALLTVIVRANYRWIEQPAIRWARTRASS